MLVVKAATLRACKYILRGFLFLEEVSSKLIFQIEPDKRLNCLQTDGICSNKANCFEACKDIEFTILQSEINVNRRNHFII